MQVRKLSLFLIFTAALVLVMAGVIYFFSHHPMGADFTTFHEIGAKDIPNLSSAVDARVALRGAVYADDRKLYDILGKKDVVAYIKKQNVSSIGCSKEDYLEFKSNNFFIRADNKSVPVVGQPQQIIAPENVVYDKDPQIIYETIRQGQVYSIFGSIQLDMMASPAIIYISPYRVTTKPIQAVKDEAEAANQRVQFNQYLVVFIVVAAYIIALWQSGAVIRRPECVPIEDFKEETEK